MDILRDYQRRAVEASSGVVRGSVVMACGTGKSVVAVHAALGADAAAGSSGGGAVVVFVPTLSLLEQTFNSWRRNAPVRFEALGVCSRAPRGSEDIGLEEVTVATTTDPAVLAARVRAARESDCQLVVFVTYQSAPVVAAAHRGHELPGWATMVCDEAHRTAGLKANAFAAVLDDDQIPAERRLFYTATPRIHDSEKTTGSGDAVTVASMDDPVLFGERLFTLPTREAIEQGWLSDYRLAVIAVSNAQVRQTLRHLDSVQVGGREVTAQHAAGIIALEAAVEEYGLQSVLAFHNSIAASKAFTTAVAPVREALGVAGPVAATHVDGRHSLAARREALQTLVGPPVGGWSLVSNARCFTEGIDVPALDAVLFAEARTSPIEVAQAVGRAIRLNPNRSEPSLIILAVLVDTDEDPEDAVEASEFAKTRRVIAALEDHDPAIAADLAQLRDHTINGDGIDTFRGKHVDFHSTRGIKVTDQYLRAFSLRLLPGATYDARWEENYARLREFVAEYGRLPKQGEPHATWIGYQRQAFRAGGLSGERVARLEDIPGWVWNPLDAAWEENYSGVCEFVAEHGRLPKQDEPHGMWIGVQRRAFRAGGLSGERVARLEDIPGWVWNAFDAAWEESYAGVREFVTEHGRLPQKREPHAQWITIQRKAFKSGRLSAECVARLEDTPGWVWNPYDAAWEESYAGVREFVAEHGRFPKQGEPHVQWISNQRAMFRSGGLSDDRVARLEAIQGWVWNAQEAAWEESYAGVREFVAAHGRFPKQGEPHALWVNTQRRRFNSGGLSAERVARLEDIPGWAWNTRDTAWEESYAGVREFVAAHGRLPKHREPHGKWIINQRQAFKSGGLSGERVARLEAIQGWAWNTRDTAWEESYAGVREFVAAHGRLPKQGEPHAKWIGNQRRAFKSGGLSAERVARLEDISGWTWVGR